MRYKFAASFPSPSHIGPQMTVKQWSGDFQRTEDEQIESLENGDV
jgi:hypothetical protein